MSSGYTDQGTDYDVFFEAWQSGDLKQSATRVSVDGTDFSDRFVHVSKGSPYPTPIICRVVNVDFSNLFAAKRSVPRYPNPLPWARTADVNVSIYRQPSRPTLAVSVTLSMSIHREGKVTITKTMPLYTSKPGEVVTESIYTGSDPQLWSDAGVAPNSPYQVKFDHISGPVPTMAHGHQLGQWITLNTAPYNSTIFNTLNYNHSAIHGLKSTVSQIKTTVRRLEWADSNIADATLVTNINLTVEPSVYQDTAWNGTYVGAHDFPTNYHMPEAQVNIYTAWVRLTIASNGTYLYQKGTSVGTGSITWVDIKSGQWLRNGFITSDYELIFDALGSGEFIGSHPFGSWLNTSTTRTFTSSLAVGDGTLPGTYTKDASANMTIREISTKEWAGLPDNTASNVLTMRPEVHIKPPMAIDWTGVGAWTDTYISRKDDIRDPEDPNKITTSTLWMNFYLTGVATIVNNDNAVIATSRWLPMGANPAHFEIRVVRISGDLFGSNPLSEFNVISTPVISVPISHTHHHNSGWMYGSFDTSTTFEVQVRRKAWVQHAIANQGTGIARVAIAAPTEPVWPSSYPWQADFTDDKSATINPDTPTVEVTARLTLTFNADGTMIISNSAGATLSSGRWYPTGWGTDVFEIRVVGTSGAGIVNEMTTFTTIASGSRKYQATVSRKFSESPNSTVLAPSISVEIRRKAEVAHSQTIANGANWLVRATTNPPVGTLLPTTDYNKWAGTYDFNKTWTIGPPVNAINSTGWGGTFSNIYSVGRALPAPEHTSIEAYLYFHTTSAGAIVITQHRYFRHGAFPGTNVFSEDIVLATMQVIDPAKAAGTDYELRIVFNSGTESGAGYESWVPFGTNPSPNSRRIFGTNRAYVADTGANSLNGVYSVQVRNKAWPNDISASRSFTFNTTAQLTKYVSGGGGGGGGGDNPTPPELEN